MGVAFCVLCEYAYGFQLPWGFVSWPETSVASSSDSVPHEDQNACTCSHAEHALISRGHTIKQYMQMLMQQYAEISASWEHQRQSVLYGKHTSRNKTSITLIFAWHTLKRFLQRRMNACTVPSLFIFLDAQPWLNSKEVARRNARGNSAVRYCCPGGTASRES